MTRPETRLQEIDALLAALNREQSKIDRQMREMVAPLRDRQSEIGREITTLQKKREAVDRDVKAVQKGPRVSDHAVIRFLERRHGFSFEAVRNEILTEERKRAIMSGATSIKADGLRFLVKDYCIVTALD